MNPENVSKNQVEPGEQEMREELVDTSRAIARNGRRAGDVGDVVNLRAEPNGRLSVVLAFGDGESIRYDERDVDPVASIVEEVS